MVRRYLRRLVGSLGFHSTRSWSAALRLGVLCLGLFVGSCAKEKVIAVNDRIHHDDFEYRVTNVIVMDSIGSGERQRRAAGHFYVVAFEVGNRAKRVVHEWDNSIAYIVDNQGRKYENLTELQPFLNTLSPFNYYSHHTTPAGATETTRLIFDLPGDVTEPYLMVRGELLMGDVFDGKTFAKTKVKLF